MLYDIRIDPRQLKAAAEWAVADIDQPADVELRVDDRMLIVEQGDDRTAFNTDGSEASAEYIAIAPLNRKTDRSTEDQDDYQESTDSLKEAALNWQAHDSIEED